MSYADCTRCGTSFFRADDEQWKKLCLSCWKETKAPRRHAQDDDATFMRGYLQGLEQGRRAAMAESRDGGATIDAERLRQLIRLCHPDLHNGSELATNVTSWLLDLRKRVAA